jgi:hypothetical protein
MIRAYHIPNKKRRKMLARSKIKQATKIPAEMPRIWRIRRHRAYGVGIEEEADPHSWLVACV